MGSLATQLCPHSRSFAQKNPIPMLLAKVGCSPNTIALISIAKAYVKLNQPKQSADLLNEALTFTYQKEPSFNDTELGSIASDNIAFSNIVQVYIKLNQASEFLF
jgi:hypothetical protein